MSLLSVSRALWRQVPGSSARACDPELAELLGDLVRPYGLPLRPDAGGHSYGEMLAGLVGEVVPSDQPADGLILGFAMPDVWPERATATFLSHICPGSPLAFAVCDQGCAAGFTALRLAHDYAACGGWRRVLVALAEQARPGYDLPGLVSVPTGHAAFVMACEARPAQGRQPDGGAAPGLLAVRVLSGVAAGQAAAVLRRELAALPEAAARGTALGAVRRSLVLGEGLAPLADSSLPGWPDTLPVPPGQPLTGVWRELSAWSALPGRGSLAIADYEPELGYLCLVAFGLPSPQRPARPDPPTNLRSGWPAGVRLRRRSFPSPGRWHGPPRRAC